MKQSTGNRVTERWLLPALERMSLETSWRLFGDS